jgi:phytoene dehydrogenase-like protein
MKYDAIVIGAGPNGLTAAASLAKAKRRVLVLESAAEIGGHTRTIEFAPGFRSPLNEDCGWAPPNVVKALGLKLPTKESPAWLTVASEDGTMMYLTSHSTVGNLRDAQRWAPFVERMHKFAGILGELYQLTPPDIDTKSISEILPLLGVGRKLRGLGRDDMTEFLRVMPMSVQDLLDDTFEDETLKAGVAACAIRDLQQGPRSGGTTFNLLHYMVGVSTESTKAQPWKLRSRPWFQDGPDAFAKAAASAAHNHGAEVRTRAQVARVVVRDGTVTGVTLETGEEIDASLVISTADPKRTLLRMVDPVWLDPEFILGVKNIKLRGATAFVFFAVDRAIEHTASVATISLTGDTASLERAADAAKYCEVSAEPHVEFFTPTLRWPHLAPVGTHVIAARVQYAPYHLKKGTWDEARTSDLKEKVTAAIARVVAGFESSIVHRAVLTPRDVEERFGVTEGALTQGELTLDQILFMRPVPGWGHYAMPVDGLYLGGAGCHPGPGVLGGAGYLAAKAALSSRA